MLLLVAVPDHVWCHCCQLHKQTTLVHKWDTQPSQLKLAVLGTCATHTKPHPTHTQELYNDAQGTVVFPPSTSADACPQGSKSRLVSGVVAALVVSASTQPQALKRVLDALLQQMGQDEVRGAFHLYIAQEGDDKLVRQVWAQGS